MFETIASATLLGSRCHVCHMKTQLYTDVRRQCSSKHDDDDDDDDDDGDDD